MNQFTKLTFSSLIILSLVGCAAQPYYGQSVYEQSDTRPVYSSNRYTPPPEPAYQPDPYQSAPYQENRYQNDRLYLKSPLSSKDSFPQETSKVSNLRFCQYLFFDF